MPPMRGAGSSGGRTSTRRTRRGYFEREGKIRKTKNRVDRGQTGLTARVDRGQTGLTARVDRGQTGLTAKFRQSQPEIHVRLVSPLCAGNSCQACQSPMRRK